MLNLAHEQLQKGSKYPLIAGSVSAYNRPGQTEHLDTQHAERLQQLADERIAKIQSQTPGVPLEKLPTLSTESQIEIIDAIFGRRPSKEVRGLGRGVERDMS